MKQKRYAEIKKAKCVACGACMKECPRNAIDIFKGCYARAAADVCVGCGKCAAVCPAGSIELITGGGSNEQ